MPDSLSSIRGLNDPPAPATWQAYVAHVEAEIDRLRTELEMIASDERPWHTCEHSDHAREALDG